MRWIIRIAAALFTLVVVAVLVLFLIPTDRIARVAEVEFEEITGRRLTLTGEISPQLYPQLGVTLGGMQIANAEWSDTPLMVEAGEMKVGVGFDVLFGGDVVVETLRIDAPVLRLERHKDGRTNWDFLTELGGDEPSDSQTISLPKAVLSGGTIEYKDGQTGQVETLKDLNATLTLPDFNAQGQLALTASLQGQPFALNGSVMGVQQLLDGEARDLEVKLVTGQTKIGYAGKFGINPIRSKGMLDADIADPKALFALAGQTPPIIPPGLGQRTRATAELTLTEGNQLFLRDLDLQLDQNRLTGEVDLTLSDRPEVVARLIGDELDFSSMSTDTTEGDGAANANAGGWSNAYLDVSGLNAIDGSFSFKANAVDFGSIQLGRTDLRGVLDRSRLVLDLANVSVFEGKVAGEFVVNGRGGLSVGADLSATNVAMEKLLADFAGYDRLQGRGEMRLKFLGVGETLEAIMKSLSGSGDMKVGEGAILGLDIAGMIKNLDTSYRGEGQRTVFDGIVGTFTMNEGVLTNNDLRFQSSLLTADGEGTLDIGGQHVNYRVDPTALADQLKKGIRVPVIIEGPWSNVRFRPDLKSLIDTNLEEEKERLRQLAKEKEDELRAKAEAKREELENKLKEKLSNELLRKQNEAAAVEDAVDPEPEKPAKEELKDSLEEQAKDRLRRLFGD